MAHTKAKGASKLGRDSASKRLGIKRGDGASVQAGEIIIRQRGTKYYPGVNVKQAGDDTLYAMKSGTVKFESQRRIHFDGSKKRVNVVRVVTAP